MDKNSYQIVLNDLETDKTNLQAECENLKKQYDDKLQEVSRVESAVEVIRARLKIESSTDSKDKISNENEFDQPAETLPELPDQMQKYDEKNQSSITLNDGCEHILKWVRKPLHVDDLVKELEMLGRFTSKRSLNSTLIQDGKKRFVLLGENIFDLRSRQPLSLFPELPDKSIVTRKPKTGKRKTRGFVLIDAIRDIIKELNGKEFLASEIFEKLQTKFPSEIAESRRRSVNSTLNNLIIQNELVKFRAGTFDIPALFKVKQ